MAKKKVAPIRTEEECFEDFLKEPCMKCHDKTIVKVADFTAGCTNCRASFLYGTLAQAGELARLKTIEDKKQKDAERKKFVEEISDQFIQDIPASDLAEEICSVILAKLIYSKNKFLNGSEIQGKVNDTSDMIGSETFKLYHKPVGSK